MTGLRPAGLAVVVLADGEAREAARDAAGSYDCPFCGNVTVSPEGWGDPQSYPAWMRDAYEAGGCASPACLANMTAGQLAAWREAAGQARRGGGPAPAGIGADGRRQAARRGKTRGGTGAAHRAGC